MSGSVRSGNSSAAGGLNLRFFVVCGKTLAKGCKVGAHSSSHRRSPAAGPLAGGAAVAMTAHQNGCLRPIRKVELP